MRVRFIAIGLFVLLAALGLAACDTTNTAGKKSTGSKSSKELTIYSGRKEKYMTKIVKAFEKKTGVKVTVLYGDTSALANQIIEEGRNSRADVYIAKDAGSLGFLADKGGLEKYGSKATDRVPDTMKDEDGRWVGASARARVIMYNTDLVKGKDIPKSLEDLKDPKWKGKFGIPSSANESMVGHVSGLRILKGDKYTEQLLKDILANQPMISDSHDPIRDAIARGEISVGLVNTYYVYNKKAEGAPVDASFMDQDGIGTFVNVSGLGVVKGAKNRENAGKFIDFVVGDKMQEVFAGINREMPVIESVPTKGTPALDSFKHADVKLQDLGDQIDKTIEMLERVGL